MLRHRRVTARRRRPRPGLQPRSRRPTRAAGWAVLTLVLLAAATAPPILGPTGATTPAAASEDVVRQTRAVPGAGAARPRVLFSPRQVPELQARLARDPYRTLFLRAHARALGWDTRALGDDTKEAHRDLSRAATWWAFEYALDRTVVGDAIVPFPDAAARQARGDRVRELLLNLYPRSRLAVPPPIGGWDRDISTSEEIVSYATAYDTLLGAGYDLGTDQAAIVDRLASVTGELYLNYVDPPTAGGASYLHQNNHRSKSGAAMAVAAIVLADEVPGAADWFDEGVRQVDDVLRHILVTGDGAYGEGPFYYRFTLQNLLPLLSAWDRLLGDASWTAGDVTVPALHAHPLFRRTQRWMLDVTVPDGSMAPIDDGNPGRSSYPGLLPSDLPEAAASNWRWANAPSPYETDGNIDLSAFAIATHDDAVTPQAPWWSPTQFYVEGGTATLRSDWSADAVMALVLGEHDTASEFGRDRTGAGRAPQSHEHTDPGAFLFHAYGARLALDPGYLSFSEHNLVNKGEHHNTVLVDGEGPPPYLPVSLAWLRDRFGRPDAEGQSTLHATLDSGVVDATSVASRYRETELHRRVLLADDRYLVVGDSLEGPGSQLTWMLHGNGGGTSGGTFTATPLGGRWEVDGARLDSAIAVAGNTPTLDTAVFDHEDEHTGANETHVAVRASVDGGAAEALQILYPTRQGEAPPTITRLPGPDAALELVDLAGDRRVTVRRDPTTGAVTVVDEHLDGSLRMAYAEQATRLDHGGRTLLETAHPGTLGLRRAGGVVELLADTGDPTVAVRVPGFTPAATDGACRQVVDGDAVELSLGRERRLTMRADVPGAAPAADPGVDRRVAAGTAVALDGTASCDADGDALTPHWELVSAPRGSGWSLLGSATWTPTLHADVVGPFRARLTVTDATGRVSREQEVVVIAGPICADGVDDDLDGLIDTDDPDCDGAPPEPPPTTTTTTTTTTSVPAPVDPTSTTFGPAPGGPGDPRPTPAPVATPVAVRPVFTG